MQVRILHVVGDSKFGGASFGILRLARFWRSVNWQVEVLSTNPEMRHMAEKEGVSVLPLDVIWRQIRPWRDLKGLWKLYRHLRNRRYTLVHTHTTKAGFVGRLAAWMAGVPIVLHTAHGFAFHEASPRWKILFYTMMERFASLGCRRVIAVSRFHERWGRQLGIAAARKIVAIPNGIPEPPQLDAGQAHAVRGRWGVKPGQLVVFTPGRLAPEKGLEDLIEAFSLMGPEWREKLLLVIAGDGALRPSLEAFVNERKLHRQVRLVGFQKEIPSLLAACDLVVFPTWREGLSIALLEAMAGGCAIVTTSIGSNLEATDNGAAALIVPARRPAALLQAICKAAADPALRSELGSRARRIYEERYTQDRMLSGYHRLYLELLKELESAQSISSVLSSTHR